MLLYETYVQAEPLHFESFQLLALSVAELYASSTLTQALPSFSSWPWGFCRSDLWWYIYLNP